MTITAEEASAQFLTLLDRVSEGEPITLTRQGIPIARLVQVEMENQPALSEPDELLQRIEAFRAAHGVNQATFEEMMAEGRRH